MKCLLDMDGVLANFVLGMCDAHQRKNPYHDPANLGVWDLSDIFQIQREAFWEPANRASFWADLVPMANAYEIVALVESHFEPEDICILTSPCKMIGQCVQGKHWWLEKYFPQYAHRCLFGSRKEFCAHSESVLIDDRDYNVEVFRQHGGTGILVPRPWNKLYDKAHTVTSIAERLELCVD